jgi:hypothetical protein
MMTSPENVGFPTFSVGCRVISAAATWSWYQDQVEAVKDDPLQLQTLHHTHRETTRLFLMGVRVGDTDKYRQKYIFIFIRWCHGPFFSFVTLSFLCFFVLRI